MDFSLSRQKEVPGLHAENPAVCSVLKANVSRQSDRNEMRPSDSFCGSAPRSQK